MYDYDVLIIGGGPAGTKCAMELGKAGKKIGLIEKDAIGGVCLNRGCIPSKTYLYLVEILDTIKKAKRHGIEMGETKVLWENVRKKKDMNVKVLGVGLIKNLESHGVETIFGVGGLNSDHEVRVESTDGVKKFTAEYIVLAPGSNPLFLPIMPRGKNVISSTEVLDLDDIPESLAIIGGGVTGVEMGSIFTLLGTRVTIIEKLGSLLPSQDGEITAHLKKSLEKKGCIVHINSKVSSCKDKNGKAEVIFTNSGGNEEKILVDKALIVIGRVPNYKAEKLEKIGIEHDGKCVTLNSHLQTSLPHIFIIGDSAYQNLTAYGAEREAECVAAHILGKKKTVHYEHIPVTVFSHPEIAQIGLTEDEVKEKSIEYEVKKSDYAANAKAIIISEREGMVKIIIEKKTKKILGVHMVGAHATDLIHQALIPVIHRMTVSEWLEVVWSHPVLSEVIKSALESESK